VRISWAVFGGGIFTSAFENPYFTGLIFDDSGRFRPVLVIFDNFRGPFPFFDVSSTLSDGILAPRKRPCTIAHRKQSLKPRNWAPKLTVFIFVYLGLNALFSWVGS
jgi:hypothetical protein